MREINFRAWHINERKMYEVKQIDFFFGLAEVQWWEPQPDGSKVLRFKTVTFTDFEDEDTGVVLEEKEVILMQYTGLKDKDGKEIYEGDIVRIITGEKGVIGKVVYNPQKTAFCVEAKGFETFSLGFLSIFFKVVVLGNMYENPELLKEV